MIKLLQYINKHLDWVNILIVVLAMWKMCDLVLWLLNWISR